MLKLAFTGDATTLLARRWQSALLCARGQRDTQESAEQPRGLRRRDEDHRRSQFGPLREVIEQLETDLFERVTGLTLKDFKLLVSLRLFNDALMNMAVLNFKRYEDASLSYTGIDKHEGERVGLWDTVADADDMSVC